MLSARLNRVGFLTSMLLPSLLTGAVILILSWWLGGEQHRDEVIYQGERDSRVAHLQTATDFGIHMWQARVALIMTWSNPRDLERVASAERTMQSLLEESKRYYPLTESGANIKRLVPQYIAESQIMFDYFRTIDEAVKFGVEGAGKVYREYALHVANGEYGADWARQALIAVNHMQSASICFNGFISGMQQTNLDNAVANINAAVMILKRNSADTPTSKVLAAAKRYQQAMMILDGGVAEFHRAHRTSIKIGAELNAELADLQNRLGEQGFNFADERLRDSADKTKFITLMLIVTLVIAMTLALLVARNINQRLTTLRSEHASHPQVGLDSCH